MPKKLISIGLLLTLLIFSSVSIFTFADDAVVKGEFFHKDIVINGENIVNCRLDNPVVTYNERVYVPVDETMSSLLGVDYSMDEQSRTLSISESRPVSASPALKEEAEDTGSSVKLVPAYDREVIVSSSGKEGMPADVSEYLDLVNMPVLEKDSTMYVPVSAVVSSELLGWSVCFDGDLGLFISTDDKTDAAVYHETAVKKAEEEAAALAEQKAGMEEQAALYGKALQIYSGTLDPEKMAAYIQMLNPNVNGEDAQQMVSAFIRYGVAYGVDPVLLMSVAKCESTYYRSITNSAGTCIGLMQVNYATASQFETTRDQLYDIDCNICCGAQVLKYYLSMFGDDLMLGLTAYNCGPAAVSGGTRADTYYSNVVDTYNSIASNLN